MFDIITDSACDLTLDTAQQLQIEVVPFYVSLDGEHYRKEGKEIAVRDFYQFMVDNPRPTPRPACLLWRILRPPSGPMPRRAAGALHLLYQQDERLRGQCPQRPGAGAGGFPRC